MGHTIEHKVGYDYLEMSDKLSLGWLAPSGTFYPCFHFEHEDKAWEIVKSYYPDDKNADPSVTLMNHNWVKIVVSSLTGLFEIYWDIHKNLTKRQRDVLYPYMIVSKTAEFSIMRFDMEKEDY